MATLESAAVGLFSLIRRRRREREAARRGGSRSRPCQSPRHSRYSAVFDGARDAQRRGPPSPDLSLWTVMLLSRRLSAIALTVVAAAAVPAAADARSSHTIKPGKYIVKKVGAFDTKSTSRYRPTIRHASRAFGQPSSRFQKHGGCIVKWKKLGLRIEFYNFGGLPQDQTICGPDASYAQSFTATGRRFRTWKGLRPGMPEDEVYDRHPAAEWFDGDRYRRPAWWLRQQWSPIGDGGYYPIVSAQVRGDRITALHGWVGAAGE